MTTELVYKARDNTNDFILKSEVDGVQTPTDLSGTTKMELVFVEFTVSSGDVVGMFDWSIGGGQVNIKIGLTPELVEGKKYYPHLIVYDVTNTLGINWGQIEIYSELRG
jgi:hypothetical protein